MKTSLKWVIIFITLSINSLTYAQNTKVKNLVKDYFASLDAGKVQQVESLLAENFTGAGPFTPQPVDPKTWLMIVSGFNVAFPDMSHQIVDIFSEGKKVAVRGLFQGTNKGMLMGNSGTGNAVKLGFTTLFTLNKSNQIQSLITEFDNEAFKAQIAGKQLQ